MRILLGVLSVALGSVYTGYGVMTILDLRRWSRSLGFSHFGLAWIAMAFTCGPHHLDHGLHLLIEARRPGGLETVAVLVGLPAGVIWFALRVEALRGGPGDRSIAGSSRLVRALPVGGAVYFVCIVISGARLLASRNAVFSPRLMPNVLLFAIYVTIGYYLLRTQLLNKAAHGGWSLSGLSLGVVFPTCALMHAAWLVHAMTGTYDVDWHGLTIDWLAVPAGLYFLWVVRSLSLSTLVDWNRSVPPPAEDGGGVGRRERLEAARG